MESLCSGILSSRFSILAATPGCGLRFYLVLVFGWLATTQLLDTGWESIPHRSSLSRVPLSLNTVVVGEVDELEEDVG